MQGALCFTQPTNVIQNTFKSSEGALTVEAEEGAARGKRRGDGCVYTSYCNNQLLAGFVVKTLNTMVGEESF